MLARFRERSYEPERLDTGDYTPDEYESCLVELRRVNRWLGDAHALKRSLVPELRRAGLKEFSLLDVGAGSGYLLRVAAREAGRMNLRAELVGVELNERSCRAIREESRSFDCVAAVRADALRLPFKDGAFDYAVCSLFTHHFTDESVVGVLAEMARVARRRVFVIDLHRHALAYLLYTTAGKLLIRSRLVRQDGALSILRGFRPGELRRLAVTAGLREIEVRRRFPFRLVLSARLKGTRAAHTDL
ncbi:MAG TPA: methyltransferase domain-containing protein [Pyrinomonadaceae bacterium]|nr:methyltransferase domain-containing protein [Pyrinomonadaceae bacterium]